MSSLWADERLYWPIAFDAYTPAHRFAEGKADPQFRTRLKIASELVDRALTDGITFRGVVADSFYGEEAGCKRSLRELGVGSVLALKPSHAWWHKEGEIGPLWEATVAAEWNGTRDPGNW